MSKAKKIVLSGMLLAVLIVLSRFSSIKTPILVISFGYIPIIFSAILLGPVYSTLIAGLGDLIGALLFPFAPYFPGYTLSATITGLIYGVFLHNTKTDKEFIVKLIISNILMLVFIHIGLTTLWVAQTSGKAFMVLVPARAISAAILCPIQISTVFVLKKALEKPIEKYLKD